jgi:hypothetical protein
MNFLRSLKEVSEKDKEKEGAVKDEEAYLKDILYLGRMYDFEVENEHLMVGFQATLDKTINDTKVYNFSSIIQRVSYTIKIAHKMIISKKYSKVDTKMRGSSHQVHLQVKNVSVHAKVRDGRNEIDVEWVLLFLQLHTTQR